MATINAYGCYTLDVKFDSEDSYQASYPRL